MISQCSQAHCMPSTLACSSLLTTLEGLCVKCQGNVERLAWALDHAYCTLVLVMMPHFELESDLFYLAGLME